jgi:Uma2 family endonuclease
MPVADHLKLAYEDYLALPNNGKQYQIVEGDLFTAPAPGVQHQRLVRRLIILLDRIARENNLGEVFAAPIDVLLSPMDIVQPDVVYVASNNAGIITAQNIQGAPDLLIEVLSPSTRRLDEIIKRKRYEQTGIREYWIVDPELEILKVYRRGDLGFNEAEIVSLEGQTTLTSPLFPGITIHLAEIFLD